MYKAVVFDFDYTLGDSTPGIVQSANYALEKMGLPAQETDAIRRTIGLTLQKTFAVLTGNEDPALAQTYADHFHEMAAQVMTGSTTLYPDALRVLEALRQQGCRTAIVTTKAHRTIQRIVDRFGAQPLLDEVIGGDDVAKEKPDPEGLLWVLARFGVEKDELLYVGDSLVDAKTAEAAGVPFAAVLTGTTTAEDFAPWQPVFIGERLEEVYAFAAGRSPAFAGASC